ncbi:helix-turn-helix domain-containing protein [Nocardioides sp. NPDC058538]|uniref:helix-turn-helix domain-containing protein n=1 Tax=Nocardioides sp. NPDC058538 TaxID=3346542 RepID=UPI0036574B09
MLASTVTQISGFPDSQPTVFGHTTGGSDRLAALYKRRQAVIAEIERSHQLRRNLDAEIELELANQQHLEADQVLAAVAAAYVVDVEQLHGRARNAPLAEARHVAFWILHRRRCWLLQAVGDWLDRDHSSVLHGVRRVDADSRLLELAAQLHATARAAGAHRAPQEAA